MVAWLTLIDPLIAFVQAVLLISNVWIVRTHLLTNSLFSKWVPLVWLAFAAHSALLLEVFVNTNMWASFFSGLALIAADVVLFAITLWKIHNQDTGISVEDTIVALHGRPPAGWTGRTYFDLTDNKLYRYLNGDWVALT